MHVTDVHHHYVPEALARREGYTPGERRPVMRDDVPIMTLHDGLVDVEAHLADMDLGGVDTAVLSCLLGWDADEDVCRSVNDDVAGLRRAHPGRLTGFAHLPLHDMDAALRELDRCIGELGLPGVGLMTRVNGRLLDDESLFPLYERAEELGTGVWVHPVMLCDGHYGATERQLDRIIGREFDLVTASVRLIMGGVLDRFPGVGFVLSHFGGGISALHDRLIAKAYRFSEGLAEDFATYWRRLSFDMSGAEGGEAALRCALETIEPSQLLFGTDYPQDFTGATTDSGVGPEGVADYVARIRDLEVDERRIEGMLSGNAATMFASGALPG